MKDTLPVRNTDPGTSRAAARKAVKRRPIVRESVLALLAGDGPMTHDALISAFQRRSVTVPGWPVASASSIRTRCNELVKDKLVEAVPDQTATSSMGNTALIWRVKNVQGA